MHIFPRAGNGDTFRACVDQPIRHLYAHIPFCPAKCDYCAFVTHIGSLKLVPAYVSALAQEAELLARRADIGPLSTVYFGGGTPTMLAPKDILFLVQRFCDWFGFEDGAEVTIEAHPATVTAPSLAGYRAAGINRISFGIESAHASELHGLGRVGGETDPLRVIGLARDAGFASVAADLMYGIPGQTERSWTETLGLLVDAAPDHLSLYPLSIEPRTPFALKQRDAHLEMPNDDLVVAMYKGACDALRSAGYVHYEVGSWALPGYQCRHNLAYWHRRQHLGLGVGAHALVGDRRTVNVRRVTAYISRINEGQLAIEESEVIDSATEATEATMLQLRLLDEGMDFDSLASLAGLTFRDQFTQDLRALEAAGLIRTDSRAIYLTEAAVPVANEVWARLTP